MQAVVNAIAKYHPAFPEEIEGCTPDELEQLRGLAPQPIPDVYVEFAQLMGHSTGELVFFFDSNFHIQSLIKYHSKKSSLVIPKRYFRFGTAEDDPYKHYFLDCEADEEPSVVRFSTPSKQQLFQDALARQEWLAHSLPELVFVRGYYEYHISKFEVKQYLGAPADMGNFMEQIAAPLTMLGFWRHSQSGRGLAFYEKAETVVVAAQSVEEGSYLHIAAQKRSELRKLTDILMQQLPLRPRGA
jgi:hypothetical protein